ncbi:LysM peptidoglycan-binding domain-containing protein [Angustibacter sp. McL0619]|uniref:LysM peptidoglycan-binding domain-containing protein n=1 Tax=Angustibacter sp. McL0619 TaxID=3415676 RepID=UPI003CF5CB2E
MTAITISAPPSMRHRAPAARPARPVGSKWGARSQVAPAPTAALRLTRRGRLVITGMLASAAIVASLFVGGVGLAGTDSAPVPTRYVTVAPGETLWAIAGEVAPSVDRRDTVQRILELNALPSALVQAGQRIAVPAS